MAVKEIVDYIENGNIKNSVNYPACDMGKCNKAGRIAVLHKNVPNTISQFTSAIAHINISDMTNKSKGNYGYTMMDLDDKIDNDTVAKIQAINGVIKVRVIK